VTTTPSPVITSNACSYETQRIWGKPRSVSS